MVIKRSVCACTYTNFDSRVCITYSRHLFHVWHAGAPRFKRRRHLFHVWHLRRFKRRRHLFHVWHAGAPRFTGAAMMIERRTYTCVGRPWSCCKSQGSSRTSFKYVQSVCGAVLSVAFLLLSKFCVKVWYGMCWDALDLMQRFKFGLWFQVLWKMRCLFWGSVSPRFFGEWFM